MNKFLLAVPAFCDFVTSTLQYISLNFISGSVYQMMRGGTIVTTFIFSIVFLKAKVKKSQIGGCILAFAGVTIVGLSNMVFSSSDSGSADAVTHSLCIVITNCRVYPHHHFTVFQWVLLRLRAETTQQVSPGTTAGCRL